MLILSDLTLAQTWVYVELKLYFSSTNNGHFEEYHFLGYDAV
jgi:hypothetical protein